MPHLFSANLKIVCNPFSLAANTFKNTTTTKKTEVITPSNHHPVLLEAQKYHQNILRFFFFCIYSSNFVLSCWANKMGQSLTSVVQTVRNKKQMLCHLSLDSTVLIQNWKTRLLQNLQKNNIFFSTAVTCFAKCM